MLGESRRRSEDTVASEHQAMYVEGRRRDALPRSGDRTDGEALTSMEWGDQRDTEFRFLFLEPHEKQSQFQNMTKSTVIAASELDMIAGNATSNCPSAADLVFDAAGRPTLPNVQPSTALTYSISDFKTKVLLCAR